MSKNRTHSLQNIGFYDVLLGDFSAEYLFINIFNFAHSFHSEKETFCKNASNFRHGFSNSAILPCPLYQNIHLNQIGHILIIRHQCAVT